MWTAELKSRTRSNGFAVFVVDYTNGVDTATRTYQIASPGNDFLKNQIIQELRNLDALDSYVDGIVLGAVDVTVEEPSQDIKDANKFFEDYLKLKSLTTAQAGGFSVDAQTLSDLEVSVKQNFKEEYTKDFRWK